MTTSYSNNQVVQKLFAASESLADEPTDKERLHAVTRDYVKMIGRASELTEQRDELLEALKDLVAQFHVYTNSDDAELPDTYEAERAMAKVESKQSQSAQ